MELKIPQNGTYSISSNSDIFGSLLYTFNIDLTNKYGVTMVSPMTIIKNDSEDLTDLGRPIKFLRLNNTFNNIAYLWTVAGGYVFKALISNGLNNTFTKETAAGSPNNVCDSTLSDAIVFNNKYLVVTTSNDIYYYNSVTNTWNDITGTPLTGGGVHLLTSFGSKMYVTDAYTVSSRVLNIRSFDVNFSTPSTSGSSFINLNDTNYQITSFSCMKSNSSRIWIGTFNGYGNGCWVFAWDGNTANTPNEAYFIKDAFCILAMIIINDTPYIIDSNGRLMYFNGGSFVEVPNGSLPIKNKKVLKNAMSSVNDRWIHPNGITYVDGKIRILINNEYEDANGSIEENIASGIWEFEKNIGWYHLSSLSLYKTTTKDFGQNRISAVGALENFKIMGDQDVNSQGTMIMGATLYKNASDTINAILIDNSKDDIIKFGQKVSPRILFSNFKEYVRGIKARFNKLVLDTDGIWIKYRKTFPNPTEIQITWVDETTFTTTTDISGKENYEFEGIQGQGSGKCSHIVSITENAGVYTIVLDENYYGVETGATAKGRVQNWEKIKKIINDMDIDEACASLDSGASSIIQIKFCFQFTGEKEFYDYFLLGDKQQ